MKVIQFYSGVNSNFEEIFNEALIDTFKADGHITVSDCSKTIMELENYLKDIGTECAVIEEDYIDSNFLDDYASYYVRNFSNGRKRCCRVHFFDERYLESDIRQMIANPERDCKISEHYLGYVVVRPLRKTIVGTTCLVSYKQKREARGWEPGRHYLAVCKKNVSFFGIPLEVECTPFQEQDSNAAACATCALWSAFNVTASLFGTKVRSPSAITALAMANSISLARKFPNGGLSFGDMLYTIRQMDLEPIVVGFGNVANRPIFLGNLYAYLNLGVPVIAIMRLKEKTRKRGFHAITINGYNIASTNDASIPLQALKIDQIYANDDQRVPGSRFKIEKLPNVEKFDLIPCRGSSVNVSQDSSRYIIDYLIVPIYHKIRVSYEEVWADAVICDRGLRTKMMENIAHMTNGRIGVCSLLWDIKLVKSSDVKQEIRADMSFSEDDRICFAVKSMPRFLWCLRIMYNGKLSTDVYLDATDSGQGLKVTARVFHNREIQKLVYLISSAEKAWMVRQSAIFNALCQV